MLIINGSIRGNGGNSARIIDVIKRTSTMLDRSMEVLTLAEGMPSMGEVKTRLLNSDSFLIVTGNYWNSWGSPFQRFLEVVTAYENTEVFFGKPVACIVSMDSVGGIEIAARLHNVFSGFGCWSPPCSTVVISRVGQEAIEASQARKDGTNEHVRRPSDISVLIENLLISEPLKNTRWLRWPSLGLPDKDGPWPETGPIDYGSNPFL